MNLDEFTQQYSGCRVTFKGEGITTANNRPMSKSQRIIIEAYQDVHDMPYITIVAKALNGILPMNSLTFNQAGTIIRAGVEMLQQKEAAGADIPPEDRPILPDQMLRLHRLKGDRGSSLINIRASEILGEIGMDYKLKNLTRGEANKIINAVITTPRPRRRSYQLAYRQEEY